MEAIPQEEDEEEVAWVTDNTGYRATLATRRPVDCRASAQMTLIVPGQPTRKDKEQAANWKSLMTLADFLMTLNQGDDQGSIIISRAKN